METLVLTINLNNLLAVKAYFTSFYSGDISVKQVHEAWASLRENRDLIKAELARLKKDEIIKQYYNCYDGHRFKKDALVKYALTKHTLHGYDLWVVSLNNRVDRELYSRLNILAKINDGHYSSFNRNGAIPGWQFREKTNAESFYNLESINGEERLQRRVSSRRQKAIDHISELIQTIRNEAQAVINTERKINTDRRVRMAGSLEGRAYADLSLADTMEGILIALEDESLNFIDRLFFKVDFELLEYILRQSKYERIRTLKTPYDKYAEPTLEDIEYAVYPSLKIYQEIG